METLMPQPMTNQQDYQAVRGIPTYGELRDTEVANSYHLWKTKTFFNGPINRSQIEAVTVQLVRDVFFQDFRRDLLFTGCTVIEKEPKPAWWIGLNAISRVLGQRLANGIGSGLPCDAKINADIWLRMFHANARATIGPANQSQPFPANWTEDRVFIDAWSKALASAKGDRRCFAMYTLARYWDTFTIPARYFTDSASLALLNESLSFAKLTQFDLDSYRKDVRGDRNGLGLTPPKLTQVVVKWSDRNPRTFLVQQGYARTCGLDLKGLQNSFPINPESRTSPRLLFQRMT